MERVVRPEGEGLFQEGEIATACLAERVDVGLESQGGNRTGFRMEDVFLNRFFTTHQKFPASS